MPRMLIVVLGTVGSILWTGFLFSAHGADACEGPRSNWMQACQVLQESMEACRNVKEAPLGSRIHQELTSRQRESIARSVRVVLKERSSALAASMEKCREAALLESQAFENWRRCARGNRPRKGDPTVESPDSVTGSRKQLLSALQDLLLDEAYQQYKNHRSPAPPAYSDYQQPGWGPGASMGSPMYRGYGGYR